MLIEETEYESVILDDSLQYFVAVIMIDFPCKKFHVTFLYSFLSNHLTRPIYHTAIKKNIK